MSYGAFLFSGVRRRTSAATVFDGMNGGTSAIRHIERKTDFVTRDVHIAIWKTYAYWATWVGVAFFAVYPGCNWISAQRDPGSLSSLYFAAELDVPLMPRFIWIYLSMFLLFPLPPLFLDMPALQRLGKRLIAGTLLCGAVFLLLPSRLGFTRVMPDDPFYAAVFSRLFTLDLPFNNAPSLHVVFSALIAAALARGQRRLRWFVYGWLALICLSTLLVHQHHLLDIATGLLIAWLLQNVWTGEHSSKARRKTIC
jgi:membrane-associated phospholipid phosphatase